MLLYTLGLAFIIVLISVALLGIGLLLTGKTKIQPGACGRAPNQKRSEKCGQKISCQLCEHKNEHKETGQIACKDKPSNEITDDAVR